MKFNELSKEKVNVFEQSLTKNWNKMNILDKSIEKGKDYFVFYD